MPETNELPKNLTPVLQELLNYWTGACERLGQLPSLDDLNLIDIYKIAPRLFVGDRCQDEAGRVRYLWRFWGTSLCTFVGGDLTGKFLDQTHDQDATTAATKYYEWALENHNPHHCRQAISVVGSERTYWDYERLIVPVADRSGHPGHVIGVYFSEQEDQCIRPNRYRYSGVLS